MKLPEYVKLSEIFEILKKSDIGCAYPESEYEGLAAIREIKTYFEEKGYEVNWSEFDEFYDKVRKDEDL